jgi:hypothetical protein
MRLSRMTVIIHGSPKANEVTLWTLNYPPNMTSLPQRFTRSATNFTGASRDERMIIEAAIHLFDFERYIASGGVALRAG